MTAAANQSNGQLLGWTDFAEPGRSRYEWKNEEAFAAIKEDGSIVSWGTLNGSKKPSSFIYAGSPVKQVFSNRHAFVAVDADGRLLAWGSDLEGSNLSRIQTVTQAGVDHVFSSRRAFAALKHDGSVVTWGQPEEGGDTTDVAEQIQSGVVEVVSSGTSMAALKDDGSVVTWGLRTTDPRSEDKGGAIDTGSPRGGDSSAVASQISSGVKAIASSRYAFAALKEGGEVVAWGDPLRGGSTGDAQRLLNRNVVKIQATGTSFAALKRNGRVVTWGDRGRGGAKLITNNNLDHWGLSEALNNAVVGRSVRRLLQRDVADLYSTRYAYAAIKRDGSVVTWGSSRAGGDATAVMPQLHGHVVSITPSRYSFAALLDDGSVVCWGKEQTLPSDPEVLHTLAAGGFVTITSNRYAFAALHADGSVISWGKTGSSPGQLEPIDTSLVAASLSEGVVELFSTEYAFAALKEDGSVVTWGDPSHGGDSSSVADALSEGVVTLATPYSDVSTFKRTGDSLLTVISVDLEQDFTDVNQVLLNGVASLSAKGNSAANRLEGNAGDNLLIGRAGADQLIGRNGNDTLAGGADDDRLIGGRGRDRFVMSQGHDVIADFNPAEGDQVCVEVNGPVVITSIDGGVMLTDSEKPGSSLTVLGAVEAPGPTAPMPDWLIQC